VRACESEDLPAVPGAPRLAAHRLEEWASGRNGCSGSVRTATGSVSRPLAVTTPSIEGPLRDRYTVYRHRHRLPAHRTAQGTQASDRGLLGGPDQPVRARVRRRHLAPRHLVAAGRCRPGFGAGEHLLLLRLDARHRGAARRAASPGAGRVRRAGPLFRGRPGHRGHRAAGNDQVVRHQLPLHRARDRAEDHVLTAPRKSAVGTQRGSGPRRSGPPGNHRADHLPAAEQGCRRRGRAGRAARRAGSAVLRPAGPARRQGRAVGADRRAGAGDRHLRRRGRARRAGLQHVGIAGQPARDPCRHLLR